MSPIDPAEPPAPHVEFPRSDRGAQIGWSILIFIATFAAFLPALRGEFLNWDDGKLFLENPDYRGLGPAQIHWALVSAKLGHYHPLTWLTFSVDYCIWEMNPFGYHLTNLLFHSACAVLVFLLTRDILTLVRRTDAGAPQAALNFGAAWAALLFSVHPLRVESVAWITERRDVVSLFFLLLCARSYLMYARAGPEKRRAYSLALVWMVCSLLSKAWAITFPVVLLVLDFYPLRRIRFARGEMRRNLLILAEKLPFVLASAVVANLAIWAQSATGMEPLEKHDGYRRAAQAAYGLIFYLWKSVLPLGLAPIYEIPRQMNPFEARFIASAIGALAMTVLALRLRKRLPSLLACWIIYVVVVSPVLGLAQTGPQLVADRYSYIACLPWALLLGAGAMTLAVKASRRTPVRLVAGAIVLTLAVMTWRQTHIWRDSMSLWTHTLKVNPNSWNALNNMGMMLVEKGEMRQALDYFAKSVEVEPNNHRGWANRALASARLGRPRDAVLYYREALKSRPEDPGLLGYIANGLSSVGAYDDASPVFEKLLQKTPHDLTALMAYAVTLKHAGKTDEAIEQFNRTIARIENQIKQEGLMSPSLNENRTRYEFAIHELAGLLESRGDRAAAQALRQKLLGL